MVRTLVWLLAAVLTLPAAPVYVLLWFDTEDYIEPASDDAALRLATELDQLGVRATFKIVGEKARTLEKRRRWDVIRALARHDIGYHSENHSLQPVPAVYLRDTGWLEGAAEFERREGPGVQDLRRLFGVTPSTYGQPGSSWGPQSYRALLRLGIPTYVDEGSHVGLDEQPFWYCGVLHVFRMGRFLVRPNLREAELPQALERFDQAYAALQARGGGVISTYYHPNEFVTTEFWDGVNFMRGARPEPSEWRRPKVRTKEDSEQCYRVLRRYVEYAKAKPEVRFITARDLPQLYQNDVPAHPLDREMAARHLAERQTFLATAEGTWSAADLLQILLGLPPQRVEGPLDRRDSTYRGDTIPRVVFERAQADVADFIRHHRRLPAEVWIGAERLSLADFAATLAGSDQRAASVPVRRGNPEMERYVASDPRKTFNWIIHPEGFDGSKLLELARLQAWTLKPARLR